MNTFTEKPKTRMINEIETLQQQPRKKIKHGSVVDNIRFLNTLGVFNIKDGKLEEAERYFSQALTRVDITFLYTKVMQTPSFETSKQQQEPQQVIDQNGMATEASSKQLIPFNQQKHQKQEYDEGMKPSVECVNITADQSTPDSIASCLMYNIAQTHIRRNQINTAIEWLQKAFAKSNTNNVNNTMTVIILQTLGYCHYRCGNNDDAMIDYQQSLVLALKCNMDASILGSILNCIGVLHFHSNDIQNAMDSFNNSLIFFNNNNDNNKDECNHPLSSLSLSSSLQSVQVATVLNNIGRAHYLNADYNEALVVYNTVLPLRQQLLGNDSIDVAATFYNTGQTHHRLGNLNQAMEHYNEFLRIVLLQIGETSRDVAVVYRCMAEIYHEQRELSKAFDLLEKALQCACQAFRTNNHPEVASTLNKLGNLRFEMQDLESAMEYYKQGLEIEKATLAPNHPHIIITLTNIGHVLKHQGKYRQASDIYKQALKLQNKTFGHDSIEVAATLSSIGLMKYHLKKYNESFDLYQEALRIRRQVYDTDDHLDIASTLNSIGLVLFKQRSYELAQGCFEESLRIRRKLLGGDHLDVAILWYNMATIYLEKGESDIAIKLYKETLRVEKTVLGCHHKDVVMTLQHLGQVHQQLGYLEKALDYFETALETARTCESKENVSAKKSKLVVGTLLNLIGNLHLQMGNVESMMEYYVEACRLFRENDVSLDRLVVAGFNFYGLSKTNPPCAAVA